MLTATNFLPAHTAPHFSTGASKTAWQGCEVRDRTGSRHSYTGDVSLDLQKRGSELGNSNEMADPVCGYVRLGQAPTFRTRSTTRSPPRTASAAEGCWIGESRRRPCHESPRLPLPMKWHIPPTRVPALQDNATRKETARMSPATTPLLAARSAQLAPRTGWPMARRCVSELMLIPGCGVVELKSCCI